MAISGRLPPRHLNFDRFHKVLNGPLKSDIAEKSTFTIDSFLDQKALSNFKSVSAWAEIINFQKLLEKIKTLKNIQRYNIVTTRSFPGAQDKTPIKLIPYMRELTAGQVDSVKIKSEPERKRQINWTIASECEKIRFTTTFRDQKSEGGKKSLKTIKRCTNTRSRKIYGSKRGIT